MVGTLSKIPFIIIGGPQASGKTTAQEHIKETYRDIIILKEAAQILIEEERKRGLAIGGALVSSDFERKILDFNLKRMNEILSKGNPGKIYLEETYIFNLAHMAVKIPEMVGEYYPKYVESLKPFNVGIIFINVPPEVSFERRKPEYMRRYEGRENFDELMRKSKDYIYKIYPSFIAVYKRLPFPKRWVDATVSMQNYKKIVETTFESLCDELKIGLRRK